MVSPPVALTEISKISSLIQPYISYIEDNFEGPSYSVMMGFLLSGEYTIHAVNNEGFVILQHFSNRVHVVTAMAWSFHTKSEFSGLVSNTVDYAKQCGYDTISFRSTRKAWHRVAPLHGFIRDVNDNEYYERIFYEQAR